MFILYKACNTDIYLIVVLRNKPTYRIEFKKIVYNIRL